MTVTAAAMRLPRFASGRVAATTSAEFRPLNEKPAPLPEEDRMAAQTAAVAQALAAAEATFDATRAADLAAFEQRLAEREAEILTTIGDALAGQMAEGLAAIEEQVGRHVGTALLLFLDHAVRERAIGELAEAVFALVASGGATRVRITGPAALTGRVEAAIAPTGVAVDHVESDAADVSVAIDDTVVETSIRAWMDRLMAQAGAADDG